MCAFWNTAAPPVSPVASPVSPVAAAVSFYIAGRNFRAVVFCCGCFIYIPARKFLRREGLRGVIYYILRRNFSGFRCGGGRGNIGRARVNTECAEYPQI